MRTTSVRKPSLRPIQARNRLVRHAARSALSRRGLIAGGLAGVGSLVAGCSGTPTDQHTSSAVGRRVDHAYGSTEVPVDPQRVVVLGYTDVEVALALGVIPVGYTDFFGTGLNEWAKPLAGGAEPSRWELTDGMPIESILALEPDLIIASDALQRADYDRLSAIVPTVGPFRDDGSYGTPWREQTRRTALALNRVANGERLIKDLEDAYAQARQSHPAFTGKTVTYCWPIAPDYYAYDDTDPRVQVVLDLGLVLTEEILELKSQKADPTAGIAVGAEQLQLLDADLIIAQAYDGQRAEAEKNKLFQAIPAVRRDDVIWLPQRISDGLAFGTVLSARAILDDLVELIATRLQT